MDVDIANDDEQLSREVPPQADPELVEADSTAALEGATSNENGSLSERGYHSEDGSLSELSDIEDPFIDNNLATPSSTQSPQPHPLYPGAQIGESMGALLLKSVAAKHNLTRSAVEDILQLMCACMPEEKVPVSYTSIHRVMKHLPNAASGNYIVHRLCGTCGELLDAGTESCGDIGCIEDNKPTISFFELPVDSQLQLLFKGTHT